MKPQLEDYKFENGCIIIPLKEIERLADSWWHQVQHDRGSCQTHYNIGKMETCHNILKLYQEHCKQQHYALSNH